MYKKLQCVFISEPRIRSYPGTRYEMFTRPTSSVAHDLREELSSKNPVVSKTMDLFEAPAFDDIKSAVTSIGTGLFGCKDFCIFYTAYYW